MEISQSIGSCVRNCFPVKGITIRYSDKKYLFLRGEIELVRFLLTVKAKRRLEFLICTRSVDDQRLTAGEMDERVSNAEPAPEKSNRGD